MRKKLLFHSKDGIMDLPMKIIIIAIIMVITIPIAIAGLNHYRENQVKTDIREELKRLSSKIKEVHRAGNTSTPTIEVTFRGNFFIEINSIKIGDNILPLNKENRGGDYAKWIRYKLDGERTRKIEVGELVTNQNHDGPLVLYDGSYKLSLTHLIINDESFVAISVLN